MQSPNNTEDASQLDDAKKVKEQLSGLDKFIWQRCPYSDSKAYKTCTEATRTQAHRHLEELGVKVELRDQSRIRKSYEEAVELYNCAETVFGLFLPLAFTGPTTSKYWGAVKMLTKVR